MKIIIRGTVQGVGFRPTVYRVAKLLGLSGYVLNKGSNVEIGIKGFNA
ncbi:MAG: acylphosphatase [Halobacteriota archaeon]